VAVVSETQIMVLSLERNLSLVKNYTIDLLAYENIHDIILDSQGCEADKFKCFIATKLYQQTNIFDINSPSMFRSFAYM
jgi:hypothetical protein